MFSLIISIVAIALVIALTAATMYYGGDTLTEGRARADAAAYISGAQQVAGAIQMHNALTGDTLTSGSEISDLVTNKYLTSAPSIPNEGVLTVDQAAGELASTGVPSGTCDAINSSAGLTTRPATAEAVTTSFGCHGAADSDGEFVFKF